MSPGQIREPANFGKRAEPHTILITRNGKTRRFTVRPVVFSVFLCTVFMFMVGYFGATAYLVFRDDLIGASFAKQARMQHEYEDRIATLRAKLDRVTSRQLLDQQAIETRVQELLKRQKNIGSRSSRMGSLMERAAKSGITAPKRDVPVPAKKPAERKVPADSVTTGSVGKTGSASDEQLSLSFRLRGVEQPAHGAGMTGLAMAASLQPISPQNIPELTSSFTESLFGNVAQAIGVIDTAQRIEIDQLRLATSTRTKKIAKTLKSLGVSVPGSIEDSIGGPFVSLDHNVKFDIHLMALENSLKVFDSVTEMARALPIGEPAKGAKISSRFGSRIDPFNGRMAMHAGIDFRAKTGTPVYATGRGVVVKAGRSGGYGKIVEIRHRDGYITRYAHLSKIRVKVGQRVESGKVIGNVGSTGRSTGPHLHYEVRKHKNAIDPAKMLNAGKKIRHLL